MRNENYMDDEQLSDEEIAERRDAEDYLKWYDRTFRPWEE